MNNILRIVQLVFGRTRKDLVAVGLIFIIMMMIIPLPTILLDFLLTVNLLISVAVILNVLYIRNALEFSVFPTILLMSTIFSLALNISSTRLILSQGAQFDGKIIKAFSSFVVGSGGSQGLVIGLVIFIILVAVQFIVITKGATRVAEVAARFTLDALPGKQMSIDQEYSAGAITEEEMMKKRSELQREVDFYGAMDGSSKFVSGNVKFGIFMILVNIVGGIIMGTVIHGETLGSALSVYTIFTIGDGLISQMPSLLISTATGVIVTRAVSSGNFGDDVSTEFSAYPRMYWIISVMFAVMSLLPGFPWYIFIPMAALTGFMAYRMEYSVDKKTQKESESSEKEAPQSDDMQQFKIEPLREISLEIGEGLQELAIKESGGDLPDRVPIIRREIGLELGFVIPLVHILDNLSLKSNEYCIKIRGIEVARSEVKHGHYLCIHPLGDIESKITGERTIDPVFGKAARWLPHDSRAMAEQEGFTIIDIASLIITHLSEVIQHNADKLMSRQNVRHLIDTLKTEYPAVAEEAGKIDLGLMQKVLQGLLRERVSIRDLLTIMETLLDYVPHTKDVSFLLEKVRQSLARQISMQYVSSNGEIEAINLNVALENEFINARTETPDGVKAMLPPERRKLVHDLIGEIFYNVSAENPILLTSESARAAVSMFLREGVYYGKRQRYNDFFPVLSVQELAPGTPIKELAVIEEGDQSNVA